LKAFDDPTLALSKGTFAKVQAEIRATSESDGQRLLDTALAAQREAIAIAIRHLFALALAASVATAVLTLFMKEVPLHRDFKAAEGEAEPTPVSTDAPAEVLEATSVPGSAGGT
jgi:hypothetical protein